MVGKVGVQAGGEPVDQLLHATRQARVLGPCKARDFEGAIAPVAGHGTLAMRLGRAAQRPDVVVLDPPEVVLRLGIGEAEHGARVRLAEHVGNAVAIAIDRDLAGEIVRGRAAGARRNEQDGGGDEGTPARHDANVISALAFSRAPAITFTPDVERAFPAPT